MKTITDSIRIGNITSSEGAVAVMSNGKAKGSFGAPALTYIEECNFERRLGRSIETESNARPLTWGKFIEGRVFDLLGLEYQLVSQETIQHPEIKHWVGSPDAIKKDESGVKTVVDIKAPITPKSFCQLIAPLYYEVPLSGDLAMTAIRGEHKEGNKYYWQLVSNAILTGAKYAELVVYVPYKSEIEEIQQQAAPSTDAPTNVNWIYYANEDELPWIPDGGFYKNLNIIRFEVPVADKIELHNRMVAAGELLIKI